MRARCPVAWCTRSVTWTGAGGYAHTGLHTRHVGDVPDPAPHGMIRWKVSLHCRPDAPKADTTVLVCSTGYPSGRVSTIHHPVGTADQLVQLLEVFDDPRAAALAAMVRQAITLACPQPPYLMAGGGR